MGEEVFTITRGPSIYSARAVHGHDGNVMVTIFIAQHGIDRKHTKNIRDGCNASYSQFVLVIFY